jgi:hypothetical protein
MLTLMTVLRKRPEVSTEEFRFDSESAMREMLATPE